MLLYKFGWKNFWKRPLQNILSLLLIVAAFSFVGLYIVTISYNPRDFAKTCYFSKEIEYDYHFSDNIFMQFVYGNNSRELSIDRLPYSDVQSLREKLHSLGQGYSIDYLRRDSDDYGKAGSDYQEEPLVGLYNIENYIAKEDKVNALYNSKGEIAPYFSYIIKVREDGYKEQTGMAYHNFFKNISVCYDMDEASLKTYGFTLYGKFPQDTYDITIPWYLYKSFESYGYKNGADGEKIEINSPEDIIGKTLSLSGHAATVVGVLNSNQDLANYLKLDKVTDEQIKLGDVYIRDYGVGPILSVIVSEEYYNTQATEDSYARVSVCKNSSEELKEAYWELGTGWMNDMTSWEIRTDTKQHVMLDLELVYQIYLGYSGFALLTTEPFISMKYWAVPFGIALAAFFLTLGASRSKRQFSVLRSLGAKKKDLFFSYFLPEVILMAIAIALSFVGTMVSSYNLLLWSYAEKLWQYHIDVPPVYIMNGTAALTLVLSGLAALVVCAVSLWINIHAMRFDRVDKKNRKRIRR